MVVKGVGGGEGGGWVGRVVRWGGGGGGVEGGGVWGGGVVRGGVGGGGGDGVRGME